MSPAALAGLMDMDGSPLIVALPTADRAAAHRFYTEGLGFDAPGELADDGVPEPLQVVVNEGVRVMFIPTGGFGWVTGDHETAPPGTSECLLSLSASGPGEVDDLIARARTAGARIVGEPEQKPWGYTGTFADPDQHLWEVLAP